MTQKSINLGTADQGNGDPLRVAFGKVNDNFTELYTALGLNVGGLNLGAFEFTGSVISTTDSSAIVIDQAATITSNLSVGGDILPQTANGGDLGSSTLPWRSLYVSNNTIYIGGTAVGLDANGNLTTGGTVVGSTPSWANITGKPTIPTSFDRLVNGAYTVSLDANGNITFPQGTLLGYSDPGGFIINGAVDKDIAIYTYNGADAHGWTFGTDGSLTLPGDIRSEGNINIDINLSDSTLLRWSFGEDGSLTLPAGGVIAEVGPGAILITPTGGANEYQALMIYPTAAEGDHIHLTAGGGSTELYLGDDNHYVKLANDGFVIIRAYDGPNSAVWGFSPDGTTSIPGDIKSDSNINIEINLTDSTLRRWQFGEDGILTLPAGGVIAEGGGFTGAIRLTPAGGANAYQALLIYPTAAGDGDHIHLTAGGGTTELYLGNDSHYVKLASDGNVYLQADDGVTGAVWTFGTDGSLQLPSPGDIRSEGNINIEINLTDSTLRRWQFGEDGDLTFPDGTTQTTAFAGNAATVDILNTNGIDTNYSITFVETRDATQILRADVDLTFNSWSNTLTAGNVTTGILKIDDGVHEKFQTKADATGIVTHDCSLGHIFYHTSPDALFTVNFTNLNLSSGYATALTLIIEQGGTGFIPNSVGIGGVIQTLNWQGNATPTPSTNRTDVVTFSIINNSGTYIVLGQLTGF